MFFAYLHIIFSFWFGSQIDGQALTILAEHQQLSEKTDSNRQSYQVDFSEVFFNTNTNDSRIGIKERVFPSGLRILFRNSIAKKNHELTLKESISKYLHITEHRVIRFKCSDIIFPFNYFW